MDGTEMQERKSCIDTDVDRAEFQRRLNDVCKNKVSHSFLLTSQQYAQIIEEVKAAHSKTKKTTLDYRRIKRYAVVKTSAGERLYLVRKDGQPSQQMFVTIDETYDIIREYHLAYNHCGKECLMKAVKPLYRNVTKESVVLYLKMCNSCKNKTVNRSRTANSSLSKLPPRSEPLNDSEHFDETYGDPLETNMSTPDDIEEAEEFSHPELYSRAQIDILIVTTDPVEDYKFMAIYRDFINKYIHLKPLKSVNVDETVDVLLEIFLVFGAPNILQSKNGMDIITAVCRRISVIYPNIKVVPASGFFSDSQFKGKTNGDILKALNEWLSSSQSPKWHQGLKFIQYSLNTKFEGNICRTPSEMIFGMNPKKGIASVLAKDDYDYLMSEEDFKNALEKKENPRTQQVKQLNLEESLVSSKSFIKPEPLELDEDSIDNEEIMDDN